MLFSRNPITGILESYTDDGVYVGNVYTMGDDVGRTSKPKKSIDHAYMRRTVDRAAKRLNKNSKNGRR